METNHSSRRNFLGIMSAVGITVAISPSAMSYPTSKVRSLEEEWNLFRRNFGGKTGHNVQPVCSQQGIQRCAGHNIQSGETVYFDAENIIAQPAWIYWEKAANGPADLVITFFADCGEKKKLARINRYEIEAINRQVNIRQKTSSGVKVSLIQFLNKKEQIVTKVHRRKESTTMETVFTSGSGKMKSLTI